MRDLIEPIYKGQKMSESTYSSIDKVYPRWAALHRHFLKMTDPVTFLFADDIKGYLEHEHSRFKAQIERQVQTPHLLAYCRYISVGISRSGLALAPWHANCTCSCRVVL